MADRTLLLLIVGCAAAMLVGFLESQREPEDIANEPLGDAEPLPVLEMPPQAINSLAAYEAIVERPLFDPERRPPPPEEVAADDAASPRRSTTDTTGWRLTAVLREADALTVLIEDQTGRTLALNQGDQLGDWKIEEVTDDRVIIVADSRRQTLKLHDFEPLAAKPRKTPTYRRPRRRPVQAPVLRRPAAPPEEATPSPDNQ